MMVYNNRRPTHQNNNAETQHTCILYYILQRCKIDDGRRPTSMAHVHALQIFHPEPQYFCIYLFPVTPHHTRQNKTNVNMKLTTTVVAASLAVVALTSGAEGRLRGRDLQSAYFKNFRSSHDADDTLGSIYGGSNTAYSYGGNSYNSYGYLSNPSRSAMDAARRAGALTNYEAGRMGYSSNYRNGRNIPLNDEDDNLGDCIDDDWYMHSYCAGWMKEDKNHWTYKYLG